ncbi:MAG: hypothetical protein WKF79_00285 [Nocardioides sp.]
MSFSLTTNGSPGEVIREVSLQSANSPQIPQAFANAIIEQLTALPTNASVMLSAMGHTGWGNAQTRGQISMSATMEVQVEDVREVGMIVDEDPA